MATIKKDYVSFETAKLLKEKGFDWECSMYYDTEEIKEMEEDGDLETPEPEEVNRESLMYDYASIYIKAPSQSMAMKWLRDVHNRYIEVCTDRAHNFKDIVFRPAIYDKELDCLWESDNFSTYEQACEAAIKRCLEKLI